MDARRLAGYLRDHQMPMLHEVQHANLQYDSVASSQRCKGKEKADLVPVSHTLWVQNFFGVV